MRAINIADLVDSDLIHRLLESFMRPGVANDDAHGPGQQQEQANNGQNATDVEAGAGDWRWRKKVPRANPRLQPEPLNG